MESTSATTATTTNNDFLNTLLLLFLFLKTVSTAPDWSFRKYTSLALRFPLFLARKYSLVLSKVG